MQLDTSNILRVDLQDIYNSCEHQTAIHSRIFNEDKSNQEIVICKDDYAIIHPWAMEAASLVADACNYITSTNQSGLDAITDRSTEQIPNPYNEKEILDLTQTQKQTGERLNQGLMDILTFNVEQMEGMLPLKYTVTQTYIRSAIVEYVLFKWYELNKITDAMRLKYEQFEFWKNELRTITFNNQKAIKVRKPYRLF